MVAQRLKSWVWLSTLCWTGVSPWDCWDGLKHSATPIMDNLFTYIRVVAVLLYHILNIFFFLLLLGLSLLVIEEMAPGRSKSLLGNSPPTPNPHHHHHIDILSCGVLGAPPPFHPKWSNGWFCSSSTHSFVKCLEGLLEVRGQRTGCPSPLSVITLAVIWLAEMLAFPANLISEPGGRLGQITFLLAADWTYGEINAPLLHLSSLIVSNDCVLSPYSEGPSCFIGIIS